jgi:hypothetical protein
MMAKFVFVLFAAMAVSVSALNLPSPCPQYSLSNSNLGSTPGFVQNVLHYNALNLMSGSPVGPYFSFNEGPNCYWIPNSTLSCGLTIYEDAARSNQIGTGSISGNNFAIVNGYIGGDVTLSYTITGALLGSYPSPNLFQSQTTTVHFKPERTSPTDLNQPAIANLVKYAADLQSGTLTLWGSNGWNGSTFSGHTTGVDLRASLVCVTNPPIEVPCVPAPGSSYSVPYGCAQSAQSIRFRSTSTSIGLSFTSGPAANCNNF